MGLDLGKLGVDGLGQMARLVMLAGVHANKSGE
jgi:hypothetical protein